MTSAISPGVSRLSRSRAAYRFRTKGHTVSLPNWLSVTDASAATAIAKTAAGRDTLTRAP